MKKKVFVEYHSIVNYADKKDTLEEYYLRRRNLLDKNGYEDYPLVVIGKMKDIHLKLEEIKKLVYSPSNPTNENIL